jgi:predicted AAA+ superfamily ATPase
MIKRNIADSILDDLKRKIILLSGPRQVGKTTLAKSLMKSFAYYNFDDLDDRLILIKKEWDRRKKIIIFDEIHKMSQWKRWLKGIYDKEGITPHILVTGSSRMDIAKKIGDSLAGRHFQYQLFPLDLKELKGKASSEEIYQNLLKCSGFPEPFFDSTEKFYTKWKRSHVDLILRQDLLVQENIQDIISLETLSELIKGKIGSPLSYSSLATDLQKDIKTIQRWIKHLENHYIVFTIKPYSKNIARSILKEPKLYLFDTASVLADEGIKLENLVALSLKKEVAYLNEVCGIESNLSTLRLKGGLEVDFFIQRRNLPEILIEVKLSDDKPSKSFKVFEKYFPNALKIQLVKNLNREKTTESGIQILNVLEWLTHMDLSQ